MSPFALGLALHSTFAGATPPGEGGARSILRQQCLLRAADPKNPWALAHGITAFGPTYSAADGRQATAVIIRDYLQRDILSDGGPRAGGPIGFPRFAKDRAPVEPHPNLLVKTLLLAGLPLSSRFEASWGPVTLEELVTSVRQGFRHRPETEAYWRQIGWTLEVLSWATEPGVPIAGPGSPTVDQVMNDALTYLEVASADLRAGMIRGLPQVDKRKQGIYSHPCGGLHLLQAVFGWARHATVRAAWGPRLEEQVAVLFYRLDSEQRQYEAALEKAPEHTLPLLTQMLKFYGHFLETTGRLRRELAWTPTAEQRQSVTRARTLLAAATQRLDSLGAFRHPERVQSENAQIALDLIGDSCHAFHGWELWQ